MDAYTEIARMLGPGPVKPWLWSVAPNAADTPAVGLGVSDSEDRARTAVEETMAKYPDRSAFGALEGPAVRERCLPSPGGGYSWIESR